MDGKILEFSVDFSQFIYFSSCLMESSLKRTEFKSSDPNLNFIRSVAISKFSRYTFKAFPSIVPIFLKVLFQNEHVKA